MSTPDDPLKPAAPSESVQTSVPSSPTPGGGSADAPLPPLRSVADGSRLPSGTRAPFLRRNRWKFIVFGLLFAIGGGFALYTWASLSVAYARGDRVGYVQKLSKKGWVCPTWEGELAMSSIPGSAPQIFLFSVRSDAVAKKLNVLQGKRVAIEYAQHRGVPSSCFGETEYHVTNVRSVE